ncbi:hypothetical protein [Emcibacter sp.]|uniref:hypothetical protein n=1 Tax=Emcibacter sp. TaxID=1979954 RepID=UPI002AA93A46|nr:hypothetical protein [Emcibacter sp.]
MDVTTTYSLLALSLLLVVLANIMARRPKPLGRAWTIPWNGLQFVFIIVAILMIRHLVTLYGGNGSV